MLYKSVQKNIDMGSADTANPSLASKIYSNNNPMNTKVDVLDLLKTLAITNNEERFLDGLEPSLLLSCIGYFLMNLLVSCYFVLFYYYYSFRTEKL